MHSQFLGLLSRGQTLQAAGVALSRLIPNHETLRTLDAGNFRPVHCDCAIDVVELDIQVALLLLDDLACNAVAIDELDEVILLSRRADSGQSQSGALSAK